MRLKKLHIKGFKSFADDTEIYFNEDLIGIVGPNGSGKSNIVDSIRWVLGEAKTSELRLDSMSDVLFNGTKHRKEGRVAKATLTFDNTKNILPTDFNEVSISRILYRDGTSEYRLNNVSCRKKDITNLFIDSGIGSNSYAIISLNMVEDILHDSGGARRYMIEQAAGISKYKLRKKETIGKLKHTSEDLERVNDLLHEIERNMSSFERQAKRTQKYNELKVEYKAVSIQLAMLEITAISEKLKTLRQQKQQSEDQLLGVQTQMNKLNATIQKLKTKILEAEKSLGKDQQDFNQLLERLNKKENEKNILTQNIQNKEERLAHISNSYDSIERDRAHSHDKSITLQQKVEKLETTIEEAETKLTALQEEWQGLQKMYEALRQREKENKDAVAAHQRKVMVAEKELENLQTKHQLYQQDIEKQQQRIAELQQQNEKESQELQAQQKELHALEEDIKTQKAKAQKLEKQRQEELMVAEKMKNSLQKKQLEASSLQQRIKFMENIINKNEGIGDAAKFLLSRKADITLFSDILSIKNEAYTPIIELFFEPYMHHIIVPTRQEALNHNTIVAQAQKGKLKQLILQEVPAVHSKPQYPNGAIPLIDALEYDPEHEALIRWLTEHCYLIDKDKGEWQAQPEYSNFILLWKDEMLVSAQAKLSGGAQSLFEGVQLGRKKILEKLINSHQKTLAVTEDYRQKLKDIKSHEETINQDIKSCKKHIKTLESQQQNKQKQVFRIESFLKNHDDNLIRIKTELDTKSEQIQENNTLINQQKQHLEAITKLNIDAMDEPALAQEIADTYDKINRANIRKERQQQELYQLKGDLQMIKKDLDFHQKNITRLDNLKTKNSRQQQEISQWLKDSTVQLATIKSEVNQLLQAKSDKQKELSTFEDEYYKEKGRIFEEERSLSEIRQEANKIEKQIAAFDTQIHEESFQLKAIHERNEIEFDFKIEKIALDPQFEGVKTEVLREKRKKLHKRISNYGDINPMAVSAYNEIKDRFENISKEKEDILEAQKSLEQTMKEIEEAASTRFNESLTAIRKNFKDVFQGLFSADDDCDIILQDSDDPLEAKIEIVAKPKGKRPKSISQLSGGEKTLTAASFLFALYLLKPAPFCIFDEVDAPLDDVNVLKFNKIIRKFSKNSQFVIITHNKLTMAEVDILYGVYLKEQGVSGVSAVDFRSYKPAEILQTVSN